MPTHPRIKVGELEMLIVMSQTQVTYLKLILKLYPYSIDTVLWICGYRFQATFSYEQYLTFLFF